MRDDLKATLIDMGYTAASERGSRPFGRGELAERLKAPQANVGRGQLLAQQLGAVAP